jgi:hypothetical protein
VNGAIPLAVKTFARPLDLSNPIPCNDIISLKNPQVKCRLEERKTVLGWALNSCTLNISLPVDKHKNGQVIFFRSTQNKWKK